MRDTTAADSWARNYWNILEKCVDWSSFQTLSAVQTLGQSMGSSMADQDIVVRPGDVPAPAAVAPVAPVAGPAHVRPKPLWQPWSDSDDDSNQVRRDWLSHAAQLSAADDHQPTSSAKELPTRTKKERRRHERHHELISSAGRTKSASHPSEDSAADEDVLRRIIGSRDDAADGPLDMSTGRRLPAERSPPPPYHRSSGSDSAGYHTSPYSMYPSPPEYSSAGRPSVITCASSLRSSPAPSCPSPCSSTGSVSSSARPASPPFQSTAPSVSSVRNQRHNDDGRPPHRREVISSGMCDPVIDEHFRRSLGERYTHLFASSPASSSLAAADSSSHPSTESKTLASTVNVTGLSVDDHFAKALGETWLKLQNETNKDKEVGVNSDGQPQQPDSPLPSQRPKLILT